MDIKTAQKNHDQTTNVKDLKPDNQKNKKPIITKTKIHAFLSFIFLASGFFFNSKNIETIKSKKILDFFNYPIIYFTIGMIFTCTCASYKLASKFDRENSKKQALHHQKTTSFFSKKLITKNSFESLFLKTKSIFKSHKKHLNISTLTKYQLKPNPITFAKKILAIKNKSKQIDQK